MRHRRRTCCRAQSGAWNQNPDHPGLIMAQAFFQSHDSVGSFDPGPMSWIRPRSISDIWALRFDQPDHVVLREGATATPIWWAGHGCSVAGWMWGIADGQTAGARQRCQFKPWLHTNAS